MKRKETTPGGSAGESVVPERSTDEDRSVKRHDIRSRVSSEDTRSSGSRVREDEVQPPWLLRDVATSEEDEVQSRGVK
jgi:hypothetical protein